MTDPQQTASQATPPPKPRTFLLWLCIFLLLASTAALGWAGQRLYQQLQTLAAQSQQQATELTRSQTQVRAAQQALTAQQRLTQAQQQRLQALETLAGQRRQDWVIAEALYLVRLGQQQLVLEENVAAALSLIDAADARLAIVAEPDFISLRRLLTADSVALRGVAVPDVVGMSLRLDALMNQLDNLTAVAGEQKSVKLDAAESSETEGWQRYAQGAWQTLNDLIQIRHRDQAVAPLITPEQTQYLRLHLRLQIQQAKLALQQGEQESFRTSISQARAWIRRYFEHNYQAQIVAEQLQKLHDTELHPALPSLQGTIAALQYWYDHGALAVAEEPAP